MANKTSTQTMEKSCLLFALAVIALNCTAHTVHNSNIDEEEALLAFKSRITYDPQNILAKNWSSHASVCDWIGVSCGVRHPRVVGLNLSNFELEGTIAPHLGNLTFLRVLDISFNHFTGIIPKEIENLTGLKLIDLKSNQLTGTIPHGIFNLSSLQIVKLSSNSLHGGLPAYICDKLPKLEILALSLNQFSGEIPSNLYKCKALEQLSLSYNEFNGKIPQEIGELTNLKGLYLSGNNLIGGIPREIGNLSHLETLVISDCSIMKEIPSFVFNMSSLKTIEFANSSLSGSLPPDLHYSLPNLEELRLPSNRLSGQIFSSISKCERLLILSLAKNSFTGGIPKQVGNLTSLEYLYLNNNHLTGELAAELGNLNLVHIQVHENNLLGSIPPSIFNISTLTMLDLNSNNFVGQLPPNMGLSLPNLQEIYLSSNHFRGVLPRSITNASMLAHISISFNMLTGPIPDFGNLQYLRVLFLGLNNFTDESPNKEMKFVTSLTKCKNLERVDVSLNPINGVLPASIGNFSSNLYEFNVAGCNIKGHIPSEIGNLSSLWAIDMDNNEFTGFVPSALGKLSNLQAIYLEHNSLEGHVPFNLCRLNKLSELYLDDNRLNGTIPTCLGKLQSLRRIFLQSNSFSSSIPADFWKLRDIFGLNLSSNLLSGYIPSEIQNLRAITDLDLSWNQFSGEIPSSIGNIHSVVSLSLAHNRFHGSIPQSLGDLRGLQSLDLSFNNFSGMIPKSLEALSDLQYFDVSHNRLKGEIPRGGHFSNFTAESFMQNDGLCGEDRLQVPPCRTRTVQRSRSKRLLKYVIAPIIAVILGAAAIVFLIIRRKRLSKIQPPAKISLGVEWKRLSYQELVQATDNFDESNMLGSGSFGSVFMGTFSDGPVVAVKVFKSQLERAIKSFEVECEVMRTIRHRNLVRVISCCSNTDFKALVLEYIPNGSLEKWLYSHNYCLTLLQRLNIAVDIALALEYLHHGQEKPIVHCDLKPSNVLLDVDMTARVADFGIAQLLSDEEAEVQTNTLGTIGYIAPEYGLGGKVSTYSDVYSYGIMLLEMFTRKKPTDDEVFGEERSFRQWVSEALQEKTIPEVLATGLVEREDEHFFVKVQCATSIFRLAMECTTNLPEERIDMIETVATLRKIRAEFLASTSRGRDAVPRR